MKRLNSTWTTSAKAAEYHIVYRDGVYKVFDKAQRFRVSFATMPAAQAYIDGRSAASHNNVLSEMAALTPTGNGKAQPANHHPGTANTPATGGQ